MQGSKKESAELNDYPIPSILSNSKHNCDISEHSVGPFLQNALITLAKILQSKTSPFIWISSNSLNASRIFPLLTNQYVKWATGPPPRPKETINQCIVCDGIWGNLPSIHISEQKTKLTFLSVLIELMEQNVTSHSVWHEPLAAEHIFGKLKLASSA